MDHRIEIAQTISDMRARVRKRDLESAGFSGMIDDVRLVDVYTLDQDFSDDILERISSMLTNPVFQESKIDDSFKPEFDYAVEVGFLPGVTDNVGNTAREGVFDLLKRGLDGQTVYSSQLMFLSGDLSREDAQGIGESVANPLIQRIHVKSYDEFSSDNGMGVVVPKVNISEKPSADLVDILSVSDDELIVIGKRGIANSDGTRRGPLALDLTYMHAIRDYFKQQGRNPMDVELESLAQTWSEHCKHTIFADPIDDIADGLYKHFIQRATNEIRHAKGEKDFCISVFTDNGGVIIFDDDNALVDKGETHNSPSRLDGYGGAGTGIGGVIRDPLGTGLASKVFALNYNFCFADPREKRPLFRGRDFTQPLEGALKNTSDIIAGVRDYGNQSGIPTTNGTVSYDSRFNGKPLVFVRAAGVMPRESAGRLSHEKQAQPGDYIVMVGGKVGKDGIHGATFSSEAIDAGSPATAVQIGDPITQKKMNDAIVDEARDLGLYNSITDNGAGGLSCSVAEMGRESGGCYVDLGKVPLKYPGLNHWETWISESQERMTLAVPKDKWNDFSDLMERRDVEASVIGEFTDSGKCVVEYEGDRVMDMDMKFLHNGLPPRPMKTTFTRPTHEEPDFPTPKDLTDSIHSMLERPNIASFEFISQQYDHEVQGGSVIKPLQGRGRVNGDATVTKPILSSNKGVVMSQGINPSYSDIDTYNMAAAAIDTAIRNAVATGANLEHLALMDNFCWCSSNEPERLGQLKRAVQACYDTTVDYGTPFISGKDSMFNDFNGFDEDGNAIKISVPPTLLVSSIGVIDDVSKAISLDSKIPGDLVYVLGATHNELGGSEYFAMMGDKLRGEKFIGNGVPSVDTNVNRRLYGNLSQAIDQGLVASAQSVHRGGLAVALAKTAIGGRLGMEVDMGEIPSHTTRDDYTLFSESQGRVVVTVDPNKSDEFEEKMDDSMHSRIGRVRGDDKFIVYGKNGPIVNASVDEMLRSYKSTFKDY
ncbi:phosphoribosylformylglycinamidine synthase subunit PurL [Candidatus Pacearchaeota archaeon]|nr:phosphoribosylformylglycinamidine synthase subunit PurL [Candidatus Pacearchaeota archaeon]